MEKFTVKWHYHGFDYEFHTLDSLFSYKQVDIGTQQMIEHIELQSDSKVLDLGCGYGNPPYHTNFSVAKSFIEGSYKHLQMGGWLVMVTKRFGTKTKYITTPFSGTPSRTPYKGYIPSRSCGFWNCPSHQRSSGIPAYTFRRKYTAPYCI